MSSSRLRSSSLRHPALSLRPPPGPRFFFFFFLHSGRRRWAAESYSTSTTSRSSRSSRSSSIEAAARLSGRSLARARSAARPRTIAGSDSGQRRGMAGAENSSGVTAAGLEERMRAALQAAVAQVEDVSGGCGQSFSAVIVSPLFEKKTTLARHRLVNAALKEEIAAIHAWTPKCYTPAEWEAKRERDGLSGGVGETE